jgi:hypothetical protein
MWSDALYSPRAWLPVIASAAQSYGYLNLGMMFATGYRLLWDLNPASLNGIPTPIETLQATHTILYFSFVTLTSIGGNIVPVHPFARSLVNLESIIGQLYPATLLARLVTLQLQSGRR